MIDHFDGVIRCGIVGWEDDGMVVGDNFLAVIELTGVDVVALNCFWWVNAISKRAVL